MSLSAAVTPTLKMVRFDGSNTTLNWDFVSGVTFVDASNVTHGGTFSNVRLTDGQFHTFAMTLDFSTLQVLVYRDGEVFQSVQLSGSPVVSVNVGSCGSQFNGLEGVSGTFLLDSAAFYHGVLSSSAVRSLSAGNLPGASGSLLYNQPPFISGPPTGLSITFLSAPTILGDNVCLASGGRSTSQAIEGGTYASVAAAVMSLGGRTFPVAGGSGVLATQTQRYGVICGVWGDTLTGRSISWSVTLGVGNLYEIRVGLTGSNWRFFHAVGVSIGQPSANTNVAIGLDNDPQNGDDTYGTGGSVLLSYTY
jgi:hypothetical protein